MATRNPFFSILIATKNEEKNIIPCLESLFNQKIKDFEVLLVDNGSHDRTVDLVKNKFPKIKITIKPSFSVSYLRQIAAKQAKGEYLFFLDADQILSPNLLEECCVLIKKNNYDGLIIRERPLKIESFLQKVIWYERELMEKINRGIPRFYKRAFYETLVGQRDNLSMGEDKMVLEDAKKKNAKITITQSTIFHQDFKYLFPLLKKYIAYGKTMHLLEDKSVIYTDRFFLFFIELAKLATVRYKPVIALSIFLIKILKGLMLKYGEYLQKKIR